MGLNVSVYRRAGTDCTNGGLSATVDQLCLVNVEGPFSPTPDCPAAKLCKGPLNSVNIKPIEFDAAESDYMYGGNIASCSDSRFSEAVEALCGYSTRHISIHDRNEYK